ncbi:MAG: Holliday junction branch migration protein RuvA [Patescibacteria group bacterium]
MIMRLVGDVLETGLDYVLVDVGGVGYKVDASLSVTSKLSIGSLATLWTHEVVREDRRELFGFLERGALDLFLKLINVNGVGPKVGQKILGAYSSDEIKKAIAEGDDMMLTRVPGVGKKTAQKIVLELRGSVDLNRDETSPAESDTVEALCSLGYSSAEAKSLILKLPSGLQTMEEKIKAALRM